MLSDARHLLRILRPILPRVLKRKTLPPLAPVSSEHRDPVAQDSQCSRLPLCREGPAHTRWLPFPAPRCVPGKAGGSTHRDCVQRPSSSGAAEAFPKSLANYPRRVPATPSLPANQTTRCRACSPTAFSQATDRSQSCATQDQTRREFGPGVSGFLPSDPPCAHRRMSQGSLRAPPLSLRSLVFQLLNCLGLLKNRCNFVSPAQCNRCADQSLEAHLPGTFKVFVGVRSDSRPPRQLFLGPPCREPQDTHLFGNSTHYLARG